MTILNSYIVGQPEIVKAIVAGIFGVFLCIIIIILAIEEGKGSILCLCLLPLFLFGSICFLLMQDNTRPRIEVLLDDQKPFVQINDTYKFIEQRDSIYVFDVREGTAEYEELMGELQNENR